MVNKVFRGKKESYCPLVDVLNVDLIVGQTGKEMFCFLLGEFTPNKKCRADHTGPDQSELSFPRCVASSQSMGPTVT